MFKAISVLILSTALLSGCGQMGPLYHPKKVPGYSKKDSPFMLYP